MQRQFTNIVADTFTVTTNLNVGGQNFNPGSQIQITQASLGTAGLTISNPGVYYLNGNLTWNNPNINAITVATSGVYISGAGCTFDLQGTGSIAIYIVGSLTNVFITDFIITNSIYYGIIVGNSDNVTVQNVSLDKTLGIITYGGSNILIQNVSVNDVLPTDYLVSSPLPVAGVTIYDSEIVTLRNVVVQNVSLTGETQVDWTEHTNFGDSYSFNGIYIYDSYGVSLTNCQGNYVTGFGACGIKVQDCEYVSFDNCSGNLIQLNLENYDSYYPAATFTAQSAGILVQDTYSATHKNCTSTYSQAYGVPTFARYTGSVSGNVLTVSSLHQGYLGAGQIVNGDTIATTTILSQLTGTTGREGTYTIDTTQTISSSEMYSNNVITVVVSGFSSMNTYNTQYTNCVSQGNYLGLASNYSSSYSMSTGFYISGNDSGDTYFDNSAMASYNSCESNSMYAEYGSVAGIYGEIASGIVIDNCKLIALESYGNYGMSEPIKGNWGSTSVGINFQNCNNVTVTNCVFNSLYGETYVNGIFDGQFAYFQNVDSFNPPESVNYSCVIKNCVIQNLYCENDSYTPQGLPSEVIGIFLQVYGGTVDNCDTNGLSCYLSACGVELEFCQNITITNCRVNGVVTFGDDDAVSLAYGFAVYDCGGIYSDTYNYGVQIKNCDVMNIHGTENGLSDGSVVGFLVNSVYHPCGPTAFINCNANSVQNYDGTGVGFYIAAGFITTIDSCRAILCNYGFIDTNIGCSGYFIDNKAYFNDNANYTGVIYPTSDTYAAGDPIVYAGNLNS